MERLLAGLIPGEILSTLDLFRVRFLFCRIQGVPLAVGPFCTEFFSQNDCEILLRRAGLPGVPPRELMAYRGQIVVCSEGTPLHTARSLARALGEALPGDLHQVEYQGGELPDFSPEAALTAQFKKEVGVPPLAYLNRVRMRQAARQLARTSTPVQEVAASVGILDANYFVKRFKAAFGYTPTEFRRRYGI